MNGRVPIVPGRGRSAMKHHHARTGLNLLGEGEATHKNVDAVVATDRLPILQRMGYIRLLLYSGI